MPEYLRALVAILVLAVPALWLLRRPLTTVATDPADYRLRAFLWIFLTLVLFLSHSFWLFVVVVALVLLTVGRRDSNAIGLYFFLLLLAPPFRSPIEGFAGINRFLDIDYLRLLSLVVLLPAAIRLAMRPGTARWFGMPADKYLLGYLALQAALTAQVSSTTDVMRTVVSLSIDAFLPYYVVSRGLTDATRMRDAFAAFTGACAVMAVIAVFEAGKGWLLYSSLPSVLDVRWSYGGYQFRNTSLRAIASTGHSIYLGYVMMAALGLHLSLRPSYPAGRSWLAVALLFGAAIALSLARGPWVGAAAMLLVAALFEPNAKALLGRIALASVVALPLLMLTPMAHRIVSLLPFVGDYDAGSVDYRQQLFKVSWNVLMMNPIFGSPYYMTSGALESMRQGEGIIDMVNTYLGIALASGLVGLGLFVGVFLSSGLRLVGRLVRDPYKDTETHIVGRALLAAMVGIMVTIATVGSENAVPVVYWCVAGACAAYVHRVRVLDVEPHPAADEGATPSRARWA
jgi:O-antigen ligase